MVVTKRWEVVTSLGPTSIGEKSIKGLTRTVVGLATVSSVG